ncbi:hypothetical protein M501DRAFT_996598 [Patellaria atrata CBS 101060]|uniref:Uncharacterized protein n=1 Tax=Patellaria atrata CBS 101060 TaxID=1346257 RepID=A0A9P4S5T2_9PEZI|nr:hypothetical protein M501DRAFT_996598 [Patellaria atrata CBS 101060]
MVQYIPPPDTSLLQPLLACLPTAFVSSRPPPALRPILSPILRQRTQLLSGSNHSSDSWLLLLSWDPQRAAKLPALVENIQIEPHPVSGEIELSEVKDIKYRRLDSETLHARVPLDQFDLLPIFLWCMNDEVGGGNGWRLAELRALEDIDDGTEWFDTMTEATDASKNSFSNGTNAVNGTNGSSAEQEKDEDDDDDYWASYDRTPGRTPAQKRSPAPGSTSVQLPTRSEIEYWTRYATEVQPAMDAEDPDEAGPGPGQSTLSGNELTSRVLREPQVEPTATTNLGPQGYDSSLPPPFVNSDATISNGHPTIEQSEIEHPRPSSSASSLSGSVEKLEQQAANQTQAEIGIKNHISTDIKSLFRLARSAGIPREEFERIVKTELDVLTMLENDD